MGKQKAAVKDVTCSKCGAQTKTNPGNLHRRCPGKKDAPPREKGRQLVPAERGVWE